MTELSAEEGTRLAAELANEIRPLLAGKHPMVQAAALAQLVAMNLAGHQAELRPEMRGHHIVLIDLLAADYAEDIWGHIPEGKGTA